MDFNSDLGVNTLLAHYGEDEKLWGAVAPPIFQNSLFVFDTYKDLLSDLKDTFQAMEEGLESGAGKFRDTAQGYADQEAALKTILDGIQVDRG